MGLMEETLNQASLVAVLKVNLPKRPRPVIIRKSLTTGNWIWRCGSKQEKDCFGRWGSEVNHFRAILEATSHYYRWHVGGLR